MCASSENNLQTQRQDEGIFKIKKNICENSLLADLHNKNAKECSSD